MFHYISETSYVRHTFHTSLFAPNQTFVVLPSVVYSVLKPLYGMPHSGRCLHVTWSIWSLSLSLSISLSLALALAHGLGLAPALSRSRSRSRSGSLKDSYVLLHLRKSESESESDQTDPGQVTCKHLPECGMPYRGFKTEYTTLGKTTKV